jgi:ACS family tartrate transporter-like MFS transporter
MAAIPLSSAIGSPVSAALLGLHRAGGLTGWQWCAVVALVITLMLGHDAELERAPELAE